MSFIRASASLPVVFLSLAGLLGCQPEPPDPPAADAGGTDAGVDAGATVDGGTVADGGVTTDAGTADDGGLTTDGGTADDGGLATDGGDSDGGVAAADGGVCVTPTGALAAGAGTCASPRVASLGFNFGSGATALETWRFTAPAAGQYELSRVNCDLSMSPLEGYMYAVPVACPSDPPVLGFGSGWTTTGCVMIRVLDLTAGQTITFTIRPNVTVVGDPGPSTGADYHFGLSLTGNGTLEATEVFDGTGADVCR